MSEVFGDDFPDVFSTVLNDAETSARRHRVLLLDYRHAPTPAREVGGPYTWAEALHAARQFAVGAQAALPVSNTGRELVLVDRPGAVLLSSVAPGSAAVVLEFIVTEDEQ